MAQLMRYILASKGVRVGYEIIRRLVAYSALVYAMYELKQVTSLDKLWPLFFGLFWLYVAQGIWETLGIWYDIGEDNGVQAPGAQQAGIQLIKEIRAEQDKLESLKESLKQEREELGKLFAERDHFRETIREASAVLSKHTEKMEVLSDTLKKVHNI